MTTTRTAATAGLATTLWLVCALSGCSDPEPAPGIKATCEKLELLCGEQLEFEASQCIAEATMGPEPTPAERRCIDRADTCDEAMLCASSDAGLADAGS